MAAKRKDSEQGGFSDALAEDKAPEVTQESPAAQAPAESDELKAYKDRIAYLEATLDRMSAHMEAQEGKQLAAPAASATMHKFQVSLLHAPTVVVEAVDAANAWDVYRAQQGLLSSQYGPEISQVDPETPLGVVKRSA